MAIANADGSIVLSTKVDTKGLQKDLKGITKMAGKALLSIGALAGATAVAITKMAVSAYADYEQLVGGVETLFKGSAQKVKNYAEDAFYSAGISKNEYMRQVTSFSASLIKSTAGDTEKAADIANMALIDISDNVNKMGSTQESVTLAYQGFAKQQYQLLDNLKLGYGGTKGEMERLLRDAEALTGVKYNINNLADVYSAIHAIQEELGIAGTTALEAEKTIAGSANMTKAAWQDTLTALAGGGDIDRAMNNLVYSITKYMQNIVPVIKLVLANIAILIKNAIPMLIQGVVEAVVTSIPILISAVYNMVLGVFSGLVSGIKALFAGGTKEATKQLVNSTKNMTSNIGGAVENQEELTDAVKGTNKELKKSLASFDELNTISEDTGSGAGSGGASVGAGSGGASVGVGGSLPLGELSGSGVVNEVDETVAKIMGIVGAGLVAIGIILLCFGQIAWGIRFIIAGAGIFVASQASLKKGEASKTAKNEMHKIIAIASGAMVALGLILVFFGVINQLSIGLIVAGAVGLVTEVVINKNEIVNALKGTIGKIVALVSGALIVVGIILCFTGVALPLGIALIKVGAVGLVTVTALNWNAIKQKATDVFTSILNWVKTWGLLVLGVILVVSGIGIPFGLALIYAGAKGLTQAKDPHWMFFYDKVKEVWGLIKAYWNANIAKYFTASWWGELGRNSINGFIRFIVNGLNKLIDNLNTFGFNLPDVLGGKRVGFNISRLNVPQLAKGAVIPGGKPFIAMLGDQPSGQTNIEAPLDTIVEAVKIALGGSNGFNGRIEVPVYLGNRQIALAVREGENEMGTETVVGGFANAY